MPRRRIPFAGPSGILPLTAPSDSLPRRDMANAELSCTLASRQDAWRERGALQLYDENGFDAYAPCTRMRHSPYREVLCAARVVIQQGSTQTARTPANTWRIPEARSAAPRCGAQYPPALRPFH
jgi:hypothetical protein